MFFDPQTHTERGVPFETFMSGFASAREKASTELGISTLLIMCFLRHLPTQSAAATLAEAEPYLDQIAAVGLDSSEVGNPPELFRKVFSAARRAGLRAVAHAGEEGPPSYIADSLDLLDVDRIDHGVACEQSDALVDRLIAEAVPLTMCPLSNVKLRVFDRLEDHNLKRLLDRGVKVTINSDDPAYFGGYVGANYEAVAAALDLDRDDVAQLARNSIEASFLDAEAKAPLLADLDETVASSQ